MIRNCHGEYRRSCMSAQVKVLLRTVSVAVRGSGSENSRGHGHIADSVAARMPFHGICAGKWHVEGQAGAVCKTVGSAYPGSNPGPATSFRRSEPMTLDCVSGSFVQRERLHRPSAFGCGPCVGQIQPSADVGHKRPRWLLSCGNNFYRKHLRGPGRVCEAGWLWAMRAPVG